jgi:hypothetical protein
MVRAWVVRCLGGLDWGGDVSIWGCLHRHRHMYDATGGQQQSAGSEEGSEEEGQDTPRSGKVINQSTNHSIT